MAKKIQVVKASGEKEIFKIEKLIGSLRRAGAADSIINDIVANILEWAFDGVTTKKIYSRAFALLRKKKAGPALKYKLKQAIMELGPTGYPLEHFVGIIFEKQGYQVDVGQILEGNCVTHEMDVIATNDSTQILVECKYHSDQGKHVSVQVPLYVRSRVDDIIRMRMTLPEYHGKNFQGWIFTNTRFTEDSKQFGRCSGLKLVGWDYPAGNGLKELIDKAKIFPVTILTRLTKKEKQKLLQNGIVTCTQLYENLEILDTLELNRRKHQALVHDLQDILG